MLAALESLNRAVLTAMDTTKLVSTGRGRGEPEVSEPSEAVETRVGFKFWHSYLPTVPFPPEP